MSRAFLVITAVLIMLSAKLPAEAEEARLQYAPSRRVDHFDEYHGVRVADPYRWLEDDVRTSPEVAEWVAAQNKVTFAYLKAIPERKAIAQRLTELWNYERYSAFFKAGGRYFFYKNDGLQNQSVLYVQDSLDGEPRVLVDPNSWSKDGTIALGDVSISPEGKYLAYSVAESGSDWQTWRIIEIESGRLLDDQIKWTKFSGAAWTNDEAGFFYGRFEEPQDKDEFQGLNLNQRLCYHRVATPQTADVLVYRRADEPTWGFSPMVSEDGRYLVINIWKGTDNKYRVLVKDLAEPFGAPIDLVDHFDDEYDFIGNDGPRLYFKTDRAAPRGRVVAIELPPADGGQHKISLEEVIPQNDETLQSVSLVGNLFLAEYLKDACSQVGIYRMTGELLRELELPGLGAVGGLGGRRSDTETFYSFSNFIQPTSIYRYDLITGESKLLRTSRVKFDPADFEVRQEFYKSKDGTRVPMFLVHKRGIKLDGTNPTLLYGYGGFNIPLVPYFSVGRLAWVDLGGVLAVANLRGGGEYGEAWHKAGTKLNKQNVFDDFIAAAEWLIDEKYTQPAKLAIQGGSNGGLLVGAVMTQRPELFGACLPAVGVMDMLRFHKFTAGRYWVDDYGSADNPEEFQALRAYSPYHNLKPGTHYPATLITTADTDDRVVPGHSFKFAAELQHKQAGPAPVLIRIETRAGHGAGKPTAKQIEELADEWAFLVKNLGMKITVGR